MSATETDFPDQAWERISQEYNKSNTNTRTAKMLRSKYETLKKEARKYAAAQRQSILQTGEDAPTKIKSNLILDTVQEIMSLECPLSTFDTDKMPEPLIVEAENDADRTCVAAEAIPELLSFEMDAPVISSESLQNCNYISELNTQEQPLQQSPSAVEVESSASTGAFTQCNQCRHTKAPSKSDQKFNSYVAEKFNVVTLEQQLLREQFTQRERREQELHEYNIEIKKTELEIKRAELINRRLDIKIKRKAFEKLE